MPRILIADDDEVFLGAITKNLSAEGFDIVTAPNGIVALNILKTQEIDLVISDIRMPEMDGVELIKTIRLKSRVPVDRLPMIWTVMNLALPMSDTAS